MCVERDDKQATEATSADRNAVGETKKTRKKKMKSERNRGEEDFFCTRD